MFKYGVKLSIKLSNGNDLIINSMVYIPSFHHFIINEVERNIDCIKPLVVCDHSVLKIRDSIPEYTEGFDKYFLINNCLMLTLPAHSFHTKIQIARNTMHRIEYDKNITEDQCLDMINVKLSEESDYMSLKSLIGLMEMNDDKEELYYVYTNKYELVKYSYPISNRKSLNMFSVHGHLLEINI